MFEIGLNTHVLNNKNKIRGVFMKKLICGLFLSCLPIVGLANDKSLMTTEISIRPLEAALTAKGGVLGTEVQFELNGKKVTQHLIYISGEVAEEVISAANTGIKEAGKATRYAFEKSTEMIVISGDLAQEIISESTKHSLKVLNQGSEFVVNGARTVFYDTLMLTALARVKVKYALEMTADVGAMALRSLYGNVKFIAKNTGAAAQKMYSFTLSKIKQSMEFSKNLVLDGADVTLALAHSTLLFVTDTGVYLYDHATDNILKIASMTVSGAFELGKGIKTVALKGAGAVGNLIQNAYENIPRVSVSIEIQ